MSSKYDAIGQYVGRHEVVGQRDVELTFEVVSALAAGGLPNSTFKHKPWWANDSKVQAVAIRKAGWHVEHASLRDRRGRFAFSVRGGEHAEQDQAGSSGPTAHPGANPAAPVPEICSYSWQRERAVQDVFVRALGNAGWTVTSAADTATKARGVDVLAERPKRLLRAEVKAFPSRVYADPRRASETKKTQPSKDEDAQGRTLHASTVDDLETLTGEISRLKIKTPSNIVKTNDLKARPSGECRMEHMDSIRHGMAT